VLRLLALLVIGAVVGSAWGQATPSRTKPTALDQIPGYVRHTIEGFTVLVNQDVLRVNTDHYERKPLEVLELELKTITKLMSEKALNTLRRLIIWVEWSELVEFSSGRPGTPVAVYYGGHQLSLLQEGKHPLKAKTITILRMDLLTEEHQPKRDLGRSVLLHEMAHAVHDQLLGRNHLGIAAAFRQAMERKLYEKSQYVSTNEAEFFAELTCAYFDQLNYFPRNRRELQQHDPHTFKLMESIWGRSASQKTAPLTKTVKPLANDGSDRYDLSVKRKNVRFTQSFFGPNLGDPELNSQVLIIGSWSERERRALTRLIELAEELGPFGLHTVINSTEGYGADLNQARLAVADRPKISIVPAVGIPERNQFIILQPPQSLIFTPEGECVFRGSIYDAVTHARAAVGRKLVEELIGDDDPPPALMPAVTALTSGDSFLTAIPKLTGPASSSDPEITAMAKKLYAAILEPGETRLAAARAQSKTEPLQAFIEAEKLTASYKGTPLASKALSLANGLRNQRSVAHEIAARKSLEQIRKLDGFLSTQQGGFEPRDPAFQFRNAATLRQLQGLIQEMRKKYPDAPATQQALEIAREYGLN